MSKVTFRASTSLMEDYRLGTEITSQTTITQLVNAESESELFYSGSDGQRGTVIYDVRLDSASDTGWSVTAITPDVTPGQLAGGESNGVFTLFSVGPDTSNPDIHFAQRNATGTWSSWTVVDPSSVFTNLTSPVYVRNVTAEVVNGALELLAVLVDATGQLSIWRVDWAGTRGGWTQLGAVDSPFLDICSTLPWGDGVLGIRMNGTSPSAMDLMFFSIDGKTTATVVPRQYFRYADSALREPTAAGARYSGIFLYNDGLTGGSRSVSFIDCGVASPAPVPIDTTLTCTQIVAVSAGANPITFFALDLHMRLNIISRKDSGWARPIELGERLTQITAGLTAGGAPLVFAVDARGSNLYSMQKQPRVAGGEWAKQEIEAQLQTVEKIEVYGTTFTLMDGDGNLLPNATISVTSPETTVVSWRNQTSVIGPNLSEALTTDANGNVTLYAPTGTINTSKLVFSAPQAMDDGDAIVIDPDDHVRERLRNLSVEDARSLLSPAFQDDAVHVQQAVTAAMTYTALSPVGTTVKNARYVAAADRIAAYQRPIDPSSGRVQHWRFSVRDGRATFTELTASEAAALRVQFLASAPSDGFFDFDWLGDIVDAVANAVQSAFDYVVTTVGNAINATITCVINGFVYVFDGVIHTIERAFEVASSIFSAVRVFFEKLFDFLAWLLTGARRDIWNTKKVFEGIINQSFPALTTLCNQGVGAAAGFFAGLKQEVAANFDAAIASVGSDTFDYKSFASDPAAADVLALSPVDVAQFFLDNTVKTNWLQEKISSALGAPKFDSSLPQSVLDAFTSFSSTLTSSIGQTILDELTAVGSYLSSIAANPGDFMHSTVSGVLNMAKNLVLSILDILDALTQAFFQLAIAFLQAAKTGIFDRNVSGFFLGALYDVLNPDASEDLTVTRFVAIVCAFPTTILYRLITGNAPFSGDAKGELVGDDVNTYKKMGGLLTCIWWIVDVRLDVPPAEPYALVLGASIPILLSALLSPGATPFSLLPWDIDVNKATNGFWCAKWAPIGFTTMFTAFEKFQSGPRGNRVACGTLAVLGAGVLGTGIWKGVEESKAHTANFGSWFSNIAGPLVTVAKPLRFFPPAGPVAVLVLDSVGDIGVGVITYKKYD
jgi:hypothetical protein